MPYVPSKLNPNLEVLGEVQEFNFPNTQNRGRVDIRTELAPAANVPTQSGLSLKDSAFNGYRFEYESCLDATQNRLGLYQIANNVRAATPILWVDANGKVTFNSEAFAQSPTLDSHIATKKYVDDHSGGGGGGDATKAYVDQQDAATLVSAKASSDTGDASTLTSAKSYADSGDSTTLNVAKAWAIAPHVTSVSYYLDDPNANVFDLMVLGGKNAQGSFQKFERLSFDIGARKLSLSSMNAETGSLEDNLTVSPTSIDVHGCSIENITNSIAVNGVVCKGYVDVGDASALNAAKDFAQTNFQIKPGFIQYLVDWTVQSQPYGVGTLHKIKPATDYSFAVGLPTNDRCVMVSSPVQQRFYFYFQYGTESTPLTNLIIARDAITVGGIPIKGVANPTDAQDVATKAYADSGDAATLTAAKSYSDTGNASTLTQAKAYTDTKSSPIVLDTNSIGVLSALGFRMKNNASSATSTVFLNGNGDGWTDTYSETWSNIWSRTISFKTTTYLTFQNASGTNTIAASQPIVMASTYTPTAAKYVATKDYTDLGAIPIGGILDVPSAATLPSNFLNANGTSFNPGTYPTLYSLLGASVTPSVTARVAGFKCIIRAL